jgi:Xaa-Pro aminopeptidase
MLTREGCKARQQALALSLERDANSEWAILGDPRHLMYFTNLPVEPISWSSPPPGLLLVMQDARSMLVADNLAARRMNHLFADQIEIVPWYNHMDSPGDRRQAVIDHFLSHLPVASPQRIGVELRAVPGGLVSGLNRQFPACEIVSIDESLLRMRRCKYADELELLRRCIAAEQAGHARAWEVIRPGVTELQVYAEVVRACTEVAGQPVVVYGDFCSGPRTWLDRGGAPTPRVLQHGDLMILDFSVVIGGYRGDFTNTIAVGGRPTADQLRLYQLCAAAMSAGESKLRDGAAACDVFAALNEPLIQADSSLGLTGHGGHGIGLAHPEPPIIVPRSTHRLQTDDVVTLEPGAYVAGIGGMRFENNYLVKPDGFERLTNHRIALASH